MTDIATLAASLMDLDGGAPRTFAAGRFTVTRGESEYLVTDATRKTASAAKFSYGPGGAYPTEWKAAAAVAQGVASTGSTETAARRVLLAHAQGVVPSLADHIALGTLDALRTAAPPKDIFQDAAPDSTEPAPLVPGGDTVPRTTRPGVKPNKGPTPPALDNTLREEDLPESPKAAPPVGLDNLSAAQRRMAVRTLVANPGLDRRKVIALVTEAEHLLED